MYTKKDLDKSVLNDFSHNIDVVVRNSNNYEIYDIISFLQNLVNENDNVFCKKIIFGLNMEFGDSLDKNAFINELKDINKSFKTFINKNGVKF